LFDAAENTSFPVIFQAFPATELARILE